MRAKLSVVIPTLNAADGLHLSLPALTEGLEAGVIRELIISDGGSIDATRRIGEEAGAVVVTGAPSRGGQLRRGAHAAQGDWLLFLHADSVLPSGWSAVVKAQMQTARPAVFRLRFDQPGLMPAAVAMWANLRTRLFRLPYGDQGLLILRGQYDAAGGFPDVPLMEDVAFIRRLKGEFDLLPSLVTTSAARYVRDGWLRRGLRNVSILLRYLAGANPADLKKAYEK